MEDILKEYNSRNEEIEKINGEIEKIKSELNSAQMSLEKENERLTEAINEFGEHTMDEYGSQVIAEYKNSVTEKENAVKSVKENLSNLNKSLVKVDRSKKELATDENIITLNTSLQDIEKQLQQKDIELKKAELEYQEFILKDDKEGKIAQDFYNKQDGIRKEIQDLQKRKDEITELLGKFKEIRDAAYNRQANDIMSVLNSRKAPVQDASVQGEQAQEIPVQEAPAQETPSQETPAQGSKDLTGKQGTVPITATHESTSTNGAPVSGSKQKYDIKVGRNVEISFDNFSMKLGKETVKEGAKMTEKEVMNVLESNSIIDSSNKKVIEYALKEKIIDPVVVKSICKFGEKPEYTSKSTEMLKTYCNECLRKSKENTLTVTYDLNDLAKSNIIHLISKKEVNSDEKLRIMENGRVAERMGFGKTVGKVDKITISRIFMGIKSIFTGESVKRLPTIKEEQEAATLYNISRDRNPNFIKDLTINKEKYAELLGRIDSLNKKEKEEFNELKRNLDLENKFNEQSNKIGEIANKEYNDLAKKQTKQMEQTKKTKQENRDSHEDR